MSLKENLENFLENYQSMTELSSSTDGSDAFEMEFTHLKQISQKYRVDKVFPTSAGESDINIRKNRYKDILPFDHSRFLLSVVDNQEGSDYINANYIKGITNDKAYLAAQGPLPHTVNDFWRMLWESQTQIIVMACNEFEQGRHKCERYWVDEGEEHAFGDILVTQIRQQRVTKDFMIRTLKATKDKEEKVFNQFHYTAWPDHGVPTSVRPILEMIKLVREYQPQDSPPVVVHCSAGCGRTGTICVIDYVRHALNEERIDHNFSLYDIIVEMRRQRHAIVQTRNQYELVHRAVVSLFQDYLGIKEDYGHNYENVQLRVDHSEQPRMPPRMPGQSSNSGEKRDSGSHNYVNCNVTGKGVSMETEQHLPKFPTSSKPTRRSDSPDGGATHAHSEAGENGRAGSDSVGGAASKQAKPRQSPDDRFKSNFQAMMTAFKDIELESGGQPGGTVPTPHPQPQTRPRGLPAQKPAAASKPQISGKPGKLAKPSPPVKPGSLDGGGGLKAGGEAANPSEKAAVSRQESSPLWTVGKDASAPPARSGEKKEALRIPLKPARHLDKSKSEGGDSPISPGKRQNPMKPGFQRPKLERPSQNPPKPPTNPKPSLQRSSTGEERASVKGNHAYEEVQINLPSSERGKEGPDPSASRNFRGSPTPFDSVDGKEGGGGGITRRKTEVGRKFSNGSLPPVAGGGDGKPTRKSSESMEYAYVQQPKSMLESLIKKEQAYSEVADGGPAIPASAAGKGATEYSYVDSQNLGQPGDGFSASVIDAPYDLINFPGSTAFNDAKGSYSCLSPTEDDDDMDIPVVPPKTAESLQFVDDDDKEEKASTGGAMTKLKAAVANSKDALTRDTRGLLRRIGGAIKQPSTGASHGNPAAAAAATENAKHSNINELLEKTLRDYQPAYKEGPVMYKEQEIGFPKRVAAPRGSRSPPRSWGVRPGDVRSAQVL